MLTGVETRTSSPIRIKRNAHYQSVNTQGLYPAGEGAGYAGGILSAAVDGIKVAEAVALNMLEKNPPLARCVNVTAIRLAHAQAAEQANHDASQKKSAYRSDTDPQHAPRAR